MRSASLPCLARSATGTSTREPGPWRSTINSSIPLRISTIAAGGKNSFCAVDGNDERARIAPYHRAQSGGCRASIPDERWRSAAFGNPVVEVGSNREKGVHHHGARTYRGVATDMDLRRIVPGNGAAGERPADQVRAVSASSFRFGPGLPPASSRRMLAAGESVSTGLRHVCYVSYRQGRSPRRPV